MVGGSLGLGAVFDDGNAKFEGKGEDRIHVAGPAGQMDGDDCAGGGSKSAADGFGGQVLRVSIDVGEDGPSSKGDGATG